MARRKKKGGGNASSAWLVTFSDLITLLLTFFVLLLSMASMDRVLLSTISASMGNPSLISHSGRGRVPDRIQLLLETIRDPKNIMLQQDRIKDLLFPNEILPPEISQSTLAENLRILAHPEGVVIVLTDGLVFDKNAYILNQPGKKLLEAIVPFLHHVNADVNIAGHTDASPSPALDSYTLSGLRAQSVLGFFLQQQFKPVRFSISGYGPGRPMMFGNSPKHNEQNRRVEILVKTSQWLGKYP